jgi:molybdate transport system ATP-binding protein
MVWQEFVEVIETLLQVDIKLEVPGFMLHLEFVLGRQLGVLFGRSGAGKSLSLRAIAGLIEPDGGSILLNQRTIYDDLRGINLAPQARHIGYLPQNPALFPHQTIAENIAYGLHRIPREDRVGRVQKWIDLMNLQDQAGKYPSEVSGGQQQRAAIARALAVEPNLLLMDEPFVALDENLRSRLRSEVRRVQQETDTPILLVTHDIGEAYQLADHLIIIESGRVIQAGARDDVFRRPQSESAALLMGMTNLLKIHPGDQGSYPEFHQVFWGNQQIRVMAPEPNTPFGNQPILGIRPEDILFIREDHPLEADLGINLMEVEIVEDRSQGFDHLVCTQLVGQPGKQLMVRIPHPVFLRMNLAVGDRRRISIRPAAIHWIQIKRPVPS